MKRLQMSLLFNTAIGPATLSATMSVAMSASMASAASIAPTPVVLSGAATPNGVFTTAFGQPSVNASGQVGFLGNTNNGVTTTGGIYTAAPGVLQIAARIGTAAPGGGGNYSGFIGAVFINSAGQVAFISSLSGGSSSQGIFSGTPGSVGAVAMLNSASPAGGTYSTLGVPATINPSGRVGYLAFTGGGSVQGVYSGTPGATAPLVLTGQSAPSGGIFTSVSLPGINPSGKMVFGTAISSGPHIGGIHVSDGVTTQAVALIGAAAPGGGNYGGSFSTLSSINAAGQVAFFNSLSGTSATQGIFTGTAGSITVVARQGDASPAGGTYNVLSTVPVINSAGQVAFRADLAGGSSSRGIFLGTSSGVQTITLLGNPSPDGIGIISSFVSVNNALSLNGAGQVAFTATFSGDGVTTANDNALLAGSPGNLSVVIREGDVIDVDPTAGFDLRTVSAIGFSSGSGGEDGRNITFTDNGIIAYRLNFTDGTAGIFTSAIPEPTLIGVLATGLLPLLGRRRS